MRHDRGAHRTTRARSRARRIVTVFLATAMLATLPTLSAPAAAGSGRGKERDPRDLPALKSEKQARLTVDGVDPDDANLPLPELPALDPKKDYSKSFDKAKSKLVRRTENADIYKNTDGSETAVIAGRPVNWKDAEGKWHAIDPTLVVDGDRVRNKSGRVKVSLPRETGAAAPMATVAADGWSISYGLEGAKPDVRAHVEGDRATYRGLRDNLDVEEQALPDGVRELLVIPERPSTADDAVFRFPLNLKGVTPKREDNGSISFLDKDGRKVAGMPASVAWGEGEQPALNQGLVAPLALQESNDRWVVEVRIAGSFLADPARNYPVRIDPTINAGLDTTQYDAFGSSADPTGNYNGERQRWNGRYVDFVGYDNFPGSQQYTFQYFDLAPIMGHGITHAEWKAQVVAGRGDRFYRMYPVQDSWTADSITWNTMPNHRMDASVEGKAPADGEWAVSYITDWVDKWARGVWPSKGVSLDSAGQNSSVKFAASEDVGWDNTKPHLVVTYIDNPPAPALPLSPADGQTVIKPQELTLTATPGADPEGDALTYSFEVSTAPDPAVGTVMQSTESASLSYWPNWEGLADGETYFWRVSSSDGFSRVWSHYRSFKVNRRLGAPASVPTDALGPLTANLATGNLFTSVATRSLDTVGGSVGVDLSYNTMARSQSGLIGTYRAIGSNQVLMVRRDRSVAFSWGTGSPGGLVPADNFHVTWEGYITVPTTGSWSFGAFHDNGVRITVNGVLLVDWWGGSTGIHYGSPITLTANVTVPIKVEFQDTGDQARISLLGTNGPPEYSPWNLPQVPSSWLSTGNDALPQGWSLTAGNIDDLAYTSATVNEASLVLTGPLGTVHQYTKQAGDSWKPTLASDDIVTTVFENGSPTYVVHADDGLTYAFDAAGKLFRVLSAADDRGRDSAPRYEYNGSGRLAALVDPVGGGRIDLVYQGGGEGCPTHSAAGFGETPPNGMLCEIRYWNGTDPASADTRARTKLYYLARRLARVENPGSEVVDFAYDASGRLAKVRDPLTADVVAAGARLDDDSTRTLVSYDTSGRVTSITAPEPSAGAARPAHSYAYPTPREATVRVAGASEPNGYTRRVLVDSAGLLVEDRDAAGLVTKHTYDAAERPVSTTGPTADPNDPAAVKTTSVYDHAGRSIEAYGPAPASCFGVTPADLAQWQPPGQPDGYTGERPNGSCTTPPVPVQRTSYDLDAANQPIKGLAARYWDNPNLSGPPRAHATGVGDPEGRLLVNWGTGMPEGLTSADNWSARYTGEIEFPERGTWYLRVCADDGVRLFLDDVKLIDDWRSGANGCRDVEARNYGSRARKKIRIDSFEDTSASDIGLYWKLSGDYVLVPGDKLAPRFGLLSTATDPDGLVSATEYARPEYGLATASRVGPPATGLRTRTEYEAPGAGHMRRIRRTMPKGDGSAGDPTATGYAYFVAGDPSPANECSGVGAVGMLQSAVGPDPAGKAPPIAREYVYDKWNRPSGSRVVGDPRWTCTSYDSRGRPIGSVDSSGKTTTISYATAGEVRTTYVDSSGTTRTTVETRDLIGRVSSYTDEHGTQTRRVYDQVGRLTEVWRRFAGSADVKIEELGYDSVGRLASRTEHVSGTPRTTTYGYDPATGRPTTATKPNGVLTTTGYDAKTGMPNAVNHTKATTRLSNWSYGRSPAGRVNSEAVASDVTAGRSRTYSYDPYGRLVTTVDGSVTRRYAYDANGNRCARAAGCSSSSTPAYTYDNADRIQSSPEWASFAYDSHGNMTSATARTPVGPVGVNGAFQIDPANPTAVSVDVGQAGTVSGSLDWEGTPSYSTQTATGSLAPGATANVSASLPGIGYVAADLAWETGQTSGSTSISEILLGGSSTSRSLPVGGTGTITVSTDWDPNTFANSWYGTVGALGHVDHPIRVSANGSIGGSLHWPGGTPNPNLDLQLLDDANTVVASWSGLTGNSEVMSPEYAVSGLGPYPAARTYNLRVKSLHPGPVDYRLYYFWPVTADIDLELYNPAGTRVAQASGSTAKPETLTYDVTPATAGSYTLTARSRSFDAWVYVSATYPMTVHAPVTAKLYDPGGVVVTSSTSSSGILTIRHKTSGGGSYRIELKNDSSTVSVPGYSMPWSTTAHTTDTWTGSGAPSADLRRNMRLGRGYMTGDLTWAAVDTTTTDALDGYLDANTNTTRTLPVAATGTIQASTNWGSAFVTDGFSGSVPALGEREHLLTLGANSDIVANLFWASGTPRANLDLELVDPSGTVVASSTELSRDWESVTYQANGVSYPTTQTYKLRVKSLHVAGATDYSISASYMKTADVDLELYNPAGTRVAQANGSVAKPETLTYNVGSGATGNYTLKIIAKTHYANYSGSVTYPVQRFATVYYRLFRASGGTAVAHGSGSPGSHSFTYFVPSPDDYVLSIYVGDSQLSVPSFTSTVRYAEPSAQPTLTLKNAVGQVLAASAPGAKPATVSAAVAAGRYSLVAASDTAVAATLSGSSPGPGRQTITYDANDHATSVDDGATTAAETLSPSGRVIRRVVRDVATQAVLEDVIVGYADDSDSPAYSRPSSGGTVTTYLDDVIYTGTAAAWQHANLHGDIVGTTDAAGVFTPTPATDEFGVGDAPASRLGWLGEHERFAIGGRLGLVRMGVRLYDTNLGRFLQVDPVEGGCSNDYVYVSDPVNEFDLTGEKCPKLLRNASQNLGYGDVARVGKAAAQGDLRKGADIASGEIYKDKAQEYVKTSARMVKTTAKGLVRGALKSGLKAVSKLAVPVAVGATVVDGVCMVTNGKKNGQKTGKRAGTGEVFVPNPYRHSVPKLPRYE